MTVKSAATWSGTFVTLDATGALAAASVGPAGTLYVNGTSNAATVTISGSNPYKWTLTLPSLSAGDRCDIYITATVGGIATAAIVASDAADTKLVSGLNDIAATAIVSSGAITTSGGAVGTVTSVTNTVSANLVSILGAAITGTAAQIVAAFSKFFDKPSPTGTVNSLPDAVAGAAGGVAIVGSNMGSVTSVSGNVAGSIGSLAAQAQTDVQTATAGIAADVTDIKTATTPPGMVLP